MNDDLALKWLTRPSTRRKLTTDSLYWFGRYYFPEYFTHNSPDFHLEMTRALQFMDDFKYLIEEMFKESAKTSWAKIAVVWRIAKRKNWFIGYVCHDKDKAEAALYDIAIELQTNKLLIRDYGQLFYEESFSDVKKSKKKSLDEFITTNGIKVKAFSTSMDVRGEVHGAHRPDLFIVDDFENDKTKKSEARTSEVKNFIDAMLSGIAAYANVVFLCNKISNKGSVSYLELKAFGNRDFRLMKIPLINRKGEINWKSKFVHTDYRANFLNSQQIDKRKFVFSVEERKRTLGTARFNQEYQLIPIDDSEAVFKRDWIEKNTWSKPLSPVQLKKIITIDPQSGEKQSADFMGGSVLGYYPKDPHRYVLERIEFKGSQLDQAAQVIRIWLRHPNAWMVGVEKVMNQVAVYQLLLQWKSGMNIFDKESFPDIVKIENRNIPLVAIDPEGKDKVARAQMHQAAFERGEVHVHETMRDFIDKLASFPDVEHDDDIDTLIYALDFSYKSDFSKNDNNEYNNGGTVFSGIRKKKF